MHRLNVLLSLLLSALLALPPAGAWAQAAEQSQSKVYTQAELDQLLAPIALYPDALLSQILMAATYPLEIVEADRWMQQHPGLAGEALNTALLDVDWDPSVETLCHYPSVLAEMDRDPTRTARLGDAFLAQEADVMDTVQALRAKAQAQGALASTQQQTVVVRETYIYIEPTRPDVVYVPVYDPAYVYGSWWYPAYPPYVWYPGRPVLAAGIVFGVGVFVGAVIAGWSHCDWHHRVVIVDYHRTASFHRFRNMTVIREPGWQDWQHNSYHRRGVVYRDRATAQRYGQPPYPSTEARHESRGPGNQGRPSSPSAGAPKQGQSTPRAGAPNQGRPSTPSAGAPSQKKTPSPSTPSPGGQTKGQPSSPTVKPPRQGQPSAPSSGAPAQTRPEGQSGSGGRQHVIYPQGQSGQGEREHQGRAQ